MRVRSSSAFFHERSVRWTVALVLAGGLLVGAPQGSAAQTPATTVKDGSGSVVLQSNVDGGLLAPGSFNTGTIPATGAGTRMMWYPTEGAFRAGRVGVSSGSGSNWDPADVGDYSVAFGLDTKASGLRSTAIGKETTASGKDAVAMGDKTTASDNDAVAMGFRTTASGTDAVAMGNRTTASARSAVALGDQTTASAVGAVAMGFHTTAATSQSVTIGECNSSNTSADNTIFVAGNGTFSTGRCSRSDAFHLSLIGNATASSHDTFSDRRLKTGIRPLGEDVLQKLADLRPVRFEFKNQTTHPSGEQIGLIAQDVREEFPELVSQDSDGYLSLAYPKFTAVLLKGLQEQQARMETQNARIADLESKVASLTAENEAIEKQQRTLEKRLARLESAVKGQSNGSVLAGASTSGLWTVFLVLGAFGAGLLWRRRADARLRFRP